MQEDIKYIGYPSVAQRIGWLDSLKAFSAFAVILTHIASIGWSVLPVTSLEWLVTSVYEIATRFCVPAFFFSTGAILLNPNKTIGLKNIATHYVLRTAVIAFTVSVLFCLMQTLLYGWTGWRSLIRAAVDGPYFIWYLWALVCVYLLLPLLRPIASSAGLLNYTLILLGIVVIGKSTVLAMAPDSVLALASNNLLVFPRGAEAVFYSLLGAWFVSHEFSSRTVYLLSGLGVCALLAAVGLNYVHAATIAPDSYYVARDNALILFYSIGVFSLFRYFGSAKETGRYVRVLVSYGLEVYLIHPFLRMLMESFMPSATEWLLSDPLIANLVLSCVLYTLSIMLGVLFRLVLKPGQHALSRLRSS